ncbi:MAG: D-alanine--D-alanine ligase family protein [bacterium]
MKKRKTILVIFGGVSSEHEVSLTSASSIFANIDRDIFYPIPILIDKTGSWFTSEAIEELLKDKTDEARKVFLPPDPNIRHLIPVGAKTLPSSLSKTIDCVFPVLHGSNGEDGTVQGLFTLADLPFVGAGVCSSAICMDKEFMKIIFRSAGLPTVDFFSIYRNCPNQDIEEIVSIVRKKIKLPLFIKPANLGSSVGITKVYEWKNLNYAIDNAFRYDNKILIEEGVEPTREFECSVLGNLDPKCSDVGEIVPSRKFYDYIAKYIDDSSELIVPARIVEKLKRTIQEYSLVAFKATNCRGMARVDFLYNPIKDILYVSEINTIPGFTPISMYPKLWQESGISFTDLITKLIELAMEEHKNRKRLSYSYD